jgi:hypothetical protein
VAHLALSNASPSVREMTSDDRTKSSGKKESVGRTTARDVPFVRGAGTDSEPAPRGQRPAQLPRDPTYEAELAQVELAVLRDPIPREEPSTQQGGKRAPSRAGVEPPESVTPESPGTRGNIEVLLGPSPKPPSSGGRAVASGTLLSVGAVDPRGKTERTLETPRMFFSQADTSGQAYFKPGRIPAVTVHQTIETETVKLSDSVDPRRAKTLPRIDRAAVQRYARLEGDSEFGDEADSEAPMAMSRPESSIGLGDESSRGWDREGHDHEGGDESIHGGDLGQIHATLSPFRDQAEPSFSLDGTPTRAEPLAGRRASDAPPEPSLPDPSQVPTHRDLPMHRIEASVPPPASTPLAAPLPAPAPMPRDWEDIGPASEGPRPTTASIAAEEPERRPVLINYAAFVVALLVAAGVGLWITRTPQPQEQTVPDALPPTPVIASAPSPVAVPVSPRPVIEVAKPVAPEPPAPKSPALEPKPRALASPKAQSAPAPRKSTPSKAPRETIF